MKRSRFLLLAVFAISIPSIGFCMHNDASDAYTQERQARAWDDLTLSADKRFVVDPMVEHCGAEEADLYRLFSELIEEIAKDERRACSYWGLLGPATKQKLLTYQYLSGETVYHLAAKYGFEGFTKNIFADSLDRIRFGGDRCEKKKLLKALCCLNMSQKMPLEVAVEAGNIFTSEKIHYALNSLLCVVDSADTPFDLPKFSFDDHGNIVAPPLDDDHLSPTLSCFSFKRLARIFSADLLEHMLNGLRPSKKISVLWSLSRDIDDYSGSDFLNPIQDAVKYNPDYVNVVKYIVGKLIEDQITERDFRDYLNGVCGSNSVSTMLKEKNTHEARCLENYLDDICDKTIFARGF